MLCGSWDSITTGTSPKANDKTAGVVIGLSHVEMVVRTATEETIGGVWVVGIRPLTTSAKVVNGDDGGGVN